MQIRGALMEVKVCVLGGWVRCRGHHGLIALFQPQPSPIIHLSYPLYDMVSLFNDPPPPHTHIHTTGASARDRTAGTS